jgi:aerobic C4-dicarboxylate transport protein
MAEQVAGQGGKATRKPFYKLLYVQVLIAIVLGFLVGWLAPDIAESPWVKALGDGFIKLIKMAIAPIIFCTVVSGIAHIEDATKVGRVGIKALIYFEIVSTLALAIGLLVGNFARPGEGFSGAAGDAAAVAQYADRAAHQSTVEFILHIIPESMVGAFADGNILQVLLISILFGFALMVLGERGRSVRTLVDDLGRAFFGVIAVIMKAAPIGAFGAMAYTIGKFGPQAIGNLAGLILTFYATAAIFIFVVLGIIAWVAGFNIFRFLAYIRDEILLVLGTSSSESALPQLMEKLERLGCSKPVVGLVVPTGYSFNLDGTNIYLTLATLFIAQALGVELSLYEQGVILGVAMLTSKGATGVTGAGFVTLAATLAVVSPALVPGMAIVLGIDKFMSECRAVTNFIGNGVATIVVSAWEGELDRAALARGLGRRVDPSSVETAVTTG